MNIEAIKVRKAIEARGGYLIHIYRQLKSDGIENSKEILCKAISGWGKSKLKNTYYSSPCEYIDMLENGNNSEVYEREVVSSNENEGYVKMSFCPLLKAWRDNGASDEEIRDLCDIASEGDYSSVSDNLKLTFDKRLADLDEYCLMKILRQSKYRELVQCH